MKARVSRGTDQRAAAVRARARAVRMGFIVGVAIGAVFIAVVLAPWAASVAMRRGKAHPPPAAASPVNAR
jgi:hypothetical protein